MGALRGKRAVNPNQNSYGPIEGKKCPKCGNRMVYNRVFNQYCGVCDEHHFYRELYNAEYGDGQIDLMELIN